MGLETGTTISALDSANPLSSDDVSVGDDHLQLIKDVLKRTFPAGTDNVGPDQAVQILIAKSSAPTVDTSASGHAARAMGLLWLDTTNNLLKIRNQANDAWVTLAINPETSNSVDINAGAIDGTVIGANSAAAGTFAALVGTTATFSSTLTANGDVDLGNAVTDSITCTGRFDSDLIPLTDSARDLGTSALQWAEAHIDTGHIDTLTATGTSTLTTVDINGGAIDGTTIGATSASTGVFSSVNIAADGATVTGIKDEDDMASNSAVKLATQQSIKAYVDDQHPDHDLEFSGDSGGEQSVNLGDESLTFATGTGLTSVSSAQTITHNVDAAQPNITSLGTLTALTVDNLGVNGNTITANSGALNLTPASGSAIVLDGTINVDAGVVTGATSITSTAFVGDVTGDITGNAVTVTVADESSDTTCFPLFVTAATGDLGLKTDSGVTYNSSTGMLTSTGLTSNVTLTTNSPSTDLQAASKGYVDAVAEGLHVKSSVVCATTAAGTLSSSFENGDAVDGVTLATNDRILIKDQSTASENGIYVVKASGAPDRSDDLAAGSDASGTFCFVEEGSTYADAGFVCTSDDGSAVVGTNNLAYSQFSGAGQITAGTGLSKSGNTLSVDAAQSQITSVGTLTGLTGGTGDFNWDSNTLVVDSSESMVGIGTSSPSVELSIAGSDPQLVLWEGSDGASSSKVQLGTGAAQGFINVHKGDGTRTVQISSSGDTYFNGGDLTVDTTTFHVDSTNNRIGVGTVTPTTDLDVTGASGQEQAVIASRVHGAASGGAILRLETYNDSGAGYNSIIQLRKSNTDTLGALVDVVDGQTLGQIHFAGISRGNSGYNGGAYITGVVDGAENTYTPTNIVFHATTSTAIVNNILVVHNSGKIGIGTAAPAHAIDVVGTAGLSTGTAWTDTSDSRIKTNVQTITGAIDKIKQLRPVSFNYTDQYLSAHPEIDGAKTYNSFIAEEYENVFPNAVSVGRDLEDITPAELYVEEDDIPEGKGVGDVKTKETRETLIPDLKQYTPHDLNMYLVAAVQELETRLAALE